MLLAAEPGHFSMVFMDIQMPVMDGLESARRIRASGRADLETIPIAALTANAFTEQSRIVKAGGHERQSCQAGRHGGALSLHFPLVRGDSAAEAG